MPNYYHKIDISDFKIPKLNKVKIFESKEENQTLKNDYLNLQNRLDTIKYENPQEDSEPFFYLQEVPGNDYTSL